MATQKGPFIYDSSQHGFLAFDELKEVFHYRNLIFQLVQRDILTRYKRSVLGVAWTMLNPLGMMIVLSIAFSQILRIDTPSYPAFVLSGLLAWTFFSQTTTSAMITLVWGGTLLNRVYLPRSTFAISAMGTGLVNLGFSLVPMLVIMLATGVPIQPALLFLPIPILLLACFALGVGLIISTAAINFPDVSEMYQILLTAWMYLTPVIYPPNLLSADLKFWLELLNPMYRLVQLFRFPIYYGRLPTWDEFWPSLLVSVVFLLVGWVVFVSKSDEFAYRV